MSEKSRRRGRPPTFDRAAALEAAMIEFWRRGYDGASLAVLTKAIAVSPPTLYAAFGSKEELYCQALAHYIAQEGQARTRMLVDAPSARAGVEAYLRDAAGCYVRPDKPRGCMVASASQQDGLVGAQARAVVAGLRMMAFAAFFRRLEDGKASGELGSDVDIRILARFYAAVVQGMSAQAVDGATATMLHGVVDFALAAWPAGEAGNDRAAG